MTIEYPWHGIVSERHTLRQEWCLQINLQHKVVRELCPCNFITVVLLCLCHFILPHLLSRLPLCKEPSPLPKDTGLVGMGSHICPCLCFWMLQGLGWRATMCTPRCVLKVLWTWTESWGPYSQPRTATASTPQLHPAPMVRTQKLEEFLGYSLSADIQHTTEQNLLVSSFNSLHPKR